LAHQKQEARPVPIFSSGTKSGFAPYGNQKREGFKKLCEASGSDRELCLNFFKQSFNSAITSTVKILLLINRVNIRYIMVFK